MENKSYKIFEGVFNEFKEKYQKNFFYTERDIVWTIQKRLKERIVKLGLENIYTVFNEYPLLKGKKRANSTDLVIKNRGVVEIALEFKYEPNHNREGIDIPKEKFPVTSLNLIKKDEEKIKLLIKGGELKRGEMRPGRAIAIVIDEGGYFYNKDIENEDKWEKGKNDIYYRFVIYNSTRN